MKLSIVSGSHRSVSQSGKVARFIEQSVRRDLALDFLSIYAVDLARQKLPLWEEGLVDTHWTEVSAHFQESHAFVFVTPEWNGMVPAALKNLFLLCSGNELSHKPALIVAVSTGMGGAYSVAELRATSSKNTKVCYIPEQVIVRKVDDVLNDSEPHDSYDLSIRNRLRYSLTLLREYAKALIRVRESGVVDVVGFPYGM